jgi:hypothetical protein
MAAPNWRAIQRHCQLEQWQRAYHYAHGDPDAARHIEERKAAVLARLTAAWRQAQQKGQ